MLSVLAPRLPEVPGGLSHMDSEDLWWSSADLTINSSETESQGPRVHPKLICSPTRRDQMSPLAGGGAC